MATNTNTPCPFVNSGESLLSDDSKWYLKMFRLWVAYGLLWMLLACLPLIWYEAQYVEHHSLLLWATVVASLVSTAAIIGVGYQQSIRAQFFMLDRLCVSKDTATRKIPMQGIVTTLLEILGTKTLLRDLDVARMRRLGDIYLMFVGIKPVIVVNTAALAQTVSDQYDVFKKSDPRELNMPFFFRWVGGNNVVLANGEPWHRIRRMTHPPLNTIPAFMPIFREKAALLSTAIEDIVSSQQSGNSGKVFVNRWLKAVSLDSAGTALFGYNFNHLRDSTSAGIRAMDYVINEIFNPLRIAFPILNKLPTQSNVILTKSMDHLDNLFVEMIKSIARNQGQQSEQENVLGMLMRGKESSLLSEDELRNNIIAMVLASHETTQVSMSGALYHLAKYPEYQDSFRDEAKKIVDQLDALSLLPGAQQIEASTLLHRKIRNFYSLGNFILESLRVYSPLANQNPRTSTQDTELHGYRIPRGSLISIAIHSIHMNEQEWSRPDTFDPGRFINENCENRYAYLPFGAGARICAGRNFSIVEQKIVLCYLLSKFRISLPSKDYAVPILRGSFTGLPHDSYHLRFERIG